MKKTDEDHRARAWEIATDLLQKYEKNPAKADDLLNKGAAHLSSSNRRFCQFLFFAAIRHRSLIDALIHRLAAKQPRKRLLAVLRLGIAEFLESPETPIALIVDHAVNRVKCLGSKSEAGFVNALLRKIPAAHEALLAEAPSERGLAAYLSTRYSHPLFLVKRWLAEFGQSDTEQLLSFNQKPSSVFVRIESGDVGSDVAFLEKTDWNGFYRYTGKDNWPAVQALLESGSAYIQDPGTAVAPRLAEVQPGDSVLDLCAAPGGKSRIFAKALKGEGILVALDLPGQRIGRLRENLSKVSGQTHIVEADLLSMTADKFKEVSGVSHFDAVLLDVPCSNTGVLRRRPDTRWRVQLEDIQKMAAVQKVLLAHASQFVKPGGRLVYSTCSIETEENEAVVASFLDDYSSEFSLEKGGRQLPCDSGHDGLGAFLFRRKA